MSAEADDAPEEQPTEQPAEPTDEGEDEKPSIAPDEQAEMDLDDLAMAIEDEEGESEPADEGGESPDGDTDESESQQSEDTGDNGGSQGPFEGVSWGDMYVEVLAVVLVAAVEELSEEEADISEEEIYELATQPPVHLPNEVDRLADQKDMGEMTPQQAVVLGTSLLAGSVLVKETDVASDAIGQLMENMNT